MDEQPPRKASSLADTVRTLGPLTSVGISFVLAIVMGAGIGLALDKWLGSSPWGFLAFFAIGVAAGILNVYRAFGR
ncbi:MAG: AtpZ/AtpI family protein [Acidobacteriota bacterium]|nr:AtpZ/AtpI family protein [Acidobacteriota bacterium]